MKGIKTSDGIYWEYHGSTLTVSLECFILIDFVWKMIQGFISLQKAITRLCGGTSKKNDTKSVKKIKLNSLSYTLSVGIKPQV